MRTVGHCKPPPLTYRACAEPQTSKDHFIQKKMSFRFKAHEAASRHQLDSIVEAMVKIALERSSTH